MPLTTPVPFKQPGASTQTLQAQTGAARQIVIDTTKNTLVVMDGMTPGGYPLALENTKIKSGSPNLRINDGDEATLYGDIVLTMRPGYVPEGFEFVRDPEGMDPGVYLLIKYQDENGQSLFYYVNANVLNNAYTAGDGVAISESGQVSAKLGSGLNFNAEGAIQIDPAALDLSNLIAEGGLLYIDENGKIAARSVVSADTDNILAEGSDGGAYLPGDLGGL